jgi:ADP-ribose pyrophosphatase YjhB (NUDIX family)
VSLGLTESVYVGNGEILRVKHVVHPFEGYWHVIGGHMDEMETLKEALRREFKEVGIKIEVGRITSRLIKENFSRIKIFWFSKQLWRAQRLLTRACFPFFSY